MTGPQTTTRVTERNCPVRSRGSRVASFARAVCVPILATLGLMPAQANAQTILGRVLDEANEEPVGGVIVALVDQDGDERARTLSDSIGRFVLSPPRAGQYHLVTERFGYLETRSPLFALTTEGEAPLELMIAPAPLGLEGLEVSVEEQATRELGTMGLSPTELGQRWIDRAEIDAIPIKMDMGAIVERAAPAGVIVMRPENLSPGSEDIGLCFGLNRARNADGSISCGLIVLNGVPIAGPQALGIDPSSIESIAILTPVEASTFYGTQGGSGAILIWTRRGG